MGFIPILNKIMVTVERGIISKYSIEVMSSMKSKKYGIYYVCRFINIEI